MEQRRLQMNLLKKTLFFFIIIISFHCAEAAAAYPTHPGFVVHQKILLTKKIDGIDGALEIWRDKRLTNSDIKLLREHDPDQNPTRSLKFLNLPVKPALVALVSYEHSKAHHTVQLLPLEKTYANIKEKNIGNASKRVFLVTQDFGIEFGSYNGPITQILELDAHSIAWAKAFDKKSHKTVQISLMRSLKSAWNFDPNNLNNDILVVHCRPDGSFEEFATYYSRYHYDGLHWTLFSRSEPFFWEAEDGDQELGSTLPDLTKFP